jgi:hypothetical protein
MRVQWDARYKARQGAHWSRCQIVDISMHGCCLLLLDETTDLLHTVMIELQLPNHTAEIVVIGEQRHSSLAADGRRRIGVEFVDVGPFQERFLSQVIAALPH